MTSPLALNGPAKIYGTNFVPRQDSGWPSWNNYWENFPSAWPDMRKQIDLSYAVGANCIRIVGCLDWVGTAAITSAQYYSYWNTVLAYIQSLGMWCYPSGTGSVLSPISGLSNAAYGAAISDWLAAIAGYNSVIIGVDLINEVNAWPAQTGAQIATNCDAIYGVVKPTTSLPLTFSTYQVMSGTTIYDSANPILASVDFLDFHVYKAGGYSDYPTTAQMTTALAAHSTYDILIGEYGDPISAGTTHNENWLWACTQMGSVVDSHCRGYLMWAVTDQSNTTSDQWGFTSKTYVVRDDHTQPLVRSTTNDPTPIATPGAPIAPHDNIILASPFASSFDYNNMKFYRDGVLVSTSSLGYYADTAQAAGQTYTYTVKNSTVSNGDSAASAALVHTVPGTAIGGPIFLRS